jgi:hypothetical protein
MIKSKFKLEAPSYDTMLSNYLSKNIKPIRMNKFGFDPNV